MEIKLTYEDGSIEVLNSIPTRGHRLNWNRPITIETTWVKKFDDTGKYLTSEYNLLINLLDAKGKIVTTELDIIYDELLGWYVHYMNDEKKYYKFIDAKKDKEEFEALHNNVKTPKWYDNLINKKQKNVKPRYDKY